MATERPLAETPIADAPALRLVRPKSRPTLSVVLAVRESQSDLGEPLRGLALACAQAEAELVIIGTDARITLGRSPSAHVRHMQTTADVPMFTMRERAMRQCTGDIVLLLDCAKDAPCTWADRVRASLRPVFGRASGQGGSPASTAAWSHYFASVSAPND